MLTWTLGINGRALNSFLKSMSLTSCGKAIETRKNSILISKRKLPLTISRMYSGHLSFQKELLNSLKPEMPQPIQEKENRPFRKKPDDFSFDDLEAILQNLKKQKASGPDEPLWNFRKWLNDRNLDYVLKVINKWWASGTSPND